MDRFMNSVLKPPLQSAKTIKDPFANLSPAIQRLYEKNPARARHKIATSDAELHDGWIEQCKTEKRTIVE